MLDVCRASRGSSTGLSTGDRSGATYGRSIDLTRLDGHMDLYQTRYRVNQSNVCPFRRVNRCGRGSKQAIGLCRTVIRNHRFSGCQFRTTRNRWYELASGLNRRPDQPEGGPRIRHIPTDRPPWSPRTSRYRLEHVFLDSIAWVTLSSPTRWTAGQKHSEPYCRGAMTR
jgi:hypothetical protein